jgi:hypothetical protein
MYEVSNTRVASSVYHSHCTRAQHFFFFLRVILPSQSRSLTRRQRHKSVKSESNKPSVSQHFGRSLFASG